MAAHPDYLSAEQITEMSGMMLTAALADTSATIAEITAKLSSWRLRHDSRDPDIDQTWRKRAMSALDWHSAQRARLRAEITRRAAVRAADTSPLLWQAARQILTPQQIEEIEALARQMRPEAFPCRPEPL